MVDPKRILNFLEAHFDNIQMLFRIYRDEGAIAYIEIEQLFNNERVIDNLIEYKIIEERFNQDYIINEVYNDFIAFLLDDFALDMPSQIEKYHHSLSELYKDLQTTTNLNDTFDIISSLTKEVLKFEKQLKRNIDRLLKETKELKANNQKLDFSEKVKKASHLTQTYVTPINTILNAHSDSLSNQIDKIINYANTQRFSHADIHLRNHYQMLYNSCDNTKKEILRENRLLGSELIPLFERIKSESEILTGFINFLNNAEAFEVPTLLDRTKDRVYMTNSNALIDAKNMWEGYSDTTQEIVIKKSQIIEDSWIYDKSRYKILLLQALPLDNF
jgi:ElaB/YqjD/DUF883 family membrane-anchored ribosome-binding protein